MQFRNPEVFYFLFLVFIPILVHLFQLQKFVKVPFTNVAFLKQIQATTRKSSVLKKWLLLCIRTLGLIALLFAFSQPYISKNTALKKPVLNIYLDNSLSLGASTENGNAFQNSIYKIIDNAPFNAEYNLLTNSKKFENLSYEDFKKLVLDVKIDTRNQNLDGILLRNSQFSENQTKTLNKNILITDFQNIKYNLFTNVTGDFYALKPKNSSFSNLSVDSLSISATQNDYITLTAYIKNQGPAKNNVPIAIYNKENLLAKQVFSIDENSTTPIRLSIKKERTIAGKISISFNDIFPFDNTFYFSLRNSEKTRVLTIGKPDNFLNKIFTEDEFTYNQTSSSNVNFNTLLDNDLIIFNEVNTLSKNLEDRIQEFKKNGGTLVIIPSSASDFDTERKLLGLNSFAPKLKITDTLRISDLNSAHPFFKNVFTEKVKNFSYPFVKESFQFPANLMRGIVSYDSKSPFFGNFSTNNKVYLFTASLSKENSNFRNSPLIVTLFYTLGQLSFRQPKLYYTINDNQLIELKTKLDKDQILKVATENSTFIPLQKALQNKVELNFDQQILEAGFHYVLKENDTLATLALNNPKSESSSSFMNPKVFDYSTNPIQSFDSIEDLFQTIKDFNEVNWLWKWFISLAIVSLLAEILLLKFFKV